MPNNVFDTSTAKAAFIIPHDEASRAKCLAVEAIASDWLRKNCRIFYQRDFAINTIASTFLEEVFGFMSMLISRGGPIEETGVNICGIIVTQATNKEDEESEKEGNINIKIKFSGDYYYPEDLVGILQEYAQSEKEKYYVITKDLNRGDRETIAVIDRMAQRTLQKKFHITIVQPFIATTATCAFLTSVIQWVVDTCEETGKPVLYNISDIIECRGVLKDGRPMVHFVPGEGAKLAIKYDSTTEEE